MPENDISIKEREQKKAANKAAIANTGKTFIRYLPNIAINTIAVFALALMTMIAFKLEPSYVWSWQFLITTIVLVIIFTLSHWSMFDGKVKALHNNKENKEYIKDQEKAIKKITNTQEWFNHKDEFISSRNYGEKIDAWKIHVQNQLEYLKRKAKQKSRDIEQAQVTDEQRKHLTAEQIEKAEKELADMKAKNRYIKRKHALEEMLTDKWIAENINKINIPYNKVDKQFIETGSVIKGQTRDKTETKGKYAKDNSMQRVYSILVTVFISVFGTQLIMEKFTQEAWFIFLFRMFILVFNVVLGLNYGDTYFVETAIHNVDARVMIGDEFKVWCLEKGYATLSKKEA